MRMSGAKAATPYLVDVAVNLTDCVFRGVDWSGTRLHADDFDLMMRRAEEQNVQQMIITGTNLLQCEKAIALCRRYPDRRLLCTVGVHPAHSSEFTRAIPSPEETAAFVADDNSVVEPSRANPADMIHVNTEEEQRNAETRLARLVKLIEDNRDVVVAVGEIGIDYAELMHCPREVQERYFVAQMRAFAPLGLPFFFHSRECGMRFYELLEEEARSNPAMRKGLSVGCPSEAPPQLSGVVHSFNGSREEQDALLAMGLSLSLNGSAVRTREMARQVLHIPLDRLMLETDAPWCDIRSKDYGHAFVQTHFATVKRKKPFVLGKCLERRNEPCHLVQVVEAYVGCSAAAAAEDDASVPQPALSKEALIAALYDNCSKMFRLS